MIDRQLMASSVEKRKQIVWEIQTKLAEDDARRLFFYSRAAYCWQPQLKGMTVMVNRIYNGNRFEDLWLDN